jgi:hypothetical protein
MDDLNGRKDTPKTALLPIGINHISPNEQRWIGALAEDPQAGGREARAPGPEQDSPGPAIPVHAARNGAPRGLFRCIARTTRR